MPLMEVMSGGMGRGGAHGIRPRQGDSSSSSPQPPSSNQYYPSHGDTTGNDDTGGMAGVAVHGIYIFHNFMHNYLKHHFGCPTKILLPATVLQHNYVRT